MKRKVFIAAMAILVVACQVEQVYVIEEEPLSSVVEKEFYAFFEGEGNSETKVYVDEKLAVLWNELDEISIFNKTTRGDRYYFKGKDGANSGAFGKVSNGTGVRQELDYNYAVYPYSDDTRMTEEGDIVFMLPAEQHYKEDSFGLGANTMVAVSTDYRLLFRNVCGYLCFKLYGDNVSVTSIEILGNKGEKIAGKATLKAALGQNPGVVMTVDATDRITLTCDNPVLLGTDAEHCTSFWIAIPPVTFEEGITVTVNNSDGSFFRQRINAGIKIERHEVLRLTPKKVSQYVSFVDSEFKAYCVSNFDTNNDGEISFVEALNVTAIDCTNGSVSSMEGIECFTNLQTLHCYGNQISSLNLRQNTELTSLRCNSNQIASLDLSNNLKLNDFCCEINPLTEVILPATLTTIPQDAFYRCRELEKISIPATVTSIGNDAFAYCVKLKDITIPASVTSIGSRAFYNCSGLEAIWVSRSTPPTGGSEMFDFTNDCPIFLHELASEKDFKKAEYWSNYKDRFHSLYFSIDYSADGKVHTLQTATVGNGINIVLMGDAYTDRLIADGTYREAIEYAADAFFSREPYKSFREYFNVFYIDVVSKRESYDQSGVKTIGGVEEQVNYGETALETYVGVSGRYVGGNNGIVGSYAEQVLTANQIDISLVDDLLVMVLMNKDVYGGRCIFSCLEDGDYARGWAIAYFPTFYSDREGYIRTICHEAGGHGFAKLEDEYVETGLYNNQNVAIPDNERNSIRYLQTFGHSKNVDFSSEPNSILWARFLADDRYANEGLGVYEGAATYGLGVYRSSYNSIMRRHDESGVFNAPSREVIWYRIHKLAFGPEWVYNYEEFVAYDAINRGQASAVSRQSAPANYVEQHLPPLPPPIIMKGRSWGE